MLHLYSDILNLMCGLHKLRIVSGISFEFEVHSKVVA